MAVTSNKRQEELAQGQQQVQSAAPYKGMQGVSQNTANNLGNYQAGYKPGEAVTAAQNTLQQIQSQKPQAYTSKYGDALDNIMKQIQNPSEFKYEFNGDNLFKGYADLYTQKGKQASMDAMGQAAALTGGYGNSYAQAAGNQAYQQYLLSLYDKGIDLYDRAYQKDRDKKNDLYNQYNLMQGADDTAYGRYRDTVSDWMNEEQQAYNRYQDAQNFDYTVFQNDLNYWTGLAQVENAAWNTEQERQEAIRQYNQNYAMDTIVRITSNGQMPSADLLRAAGLSEADARAMMAQMVTTGGGGSGGSGGGGSGKENVYYHGVGDTYYQKDSNGNWIVVPESKVAADKYAVIDDTMKQNETQHLQNIADYMTTLKKQITGSSAVQNYAGTVSNALSGIGSSLSNFLTGKKKTGK